MHPITWRSLVRVQAIPLPTVDGGFQVAVHNWPSNSRVGRVLVGQGVLSSPHNSDPCRLAGRLRACLARKRPIPYYRPSPSSHSSQSSDSAHSRSRSRTYDSGSSYSRSRTLSRSRSRSRTQSRNHSHSYYSRSSSESAGF
ncbi:UNVERIFIED_CONTAM: hypothetical protein FKN15_054943 [Acipenser sinensis]